MLFSGQRTTNNLLAGIAILFTALIFSSARADDRGGQFLPLGQKNAATGTVAPQTGRQFLSLRGHNRDATPNKMIALNGGESGRTWKLNELKNTPRVATPKDVPDEVKLAMARGHMAQQDGMPPKAGDNREMIAAALAPIIESYQREPVAGMENIDTDIEDAHEALAASLPNAVHEAMDKTLDYVWPVAGAHMDISSGYGYRKHPITGQRAFHAGIDIPAPMGTEVLAAISGQVATVGEHPRLGRYVRIDHADGTYSLYGHLQEWDAKTGTQVAAGDVIGKVGSTGRSTGPHLDFSIRRDGKPFNPMQIFSGVLAQKKLAMNE